MRRLFEVLFISILLFAGCSRKPIEHPFQNISYETFSKQRNDNYAVNNLRIRMFIDSLRLAERDTSYVDLLTNRYYADHRPYLWIDRMGTDLRPDTVLSWLDSIEAEGVNPRHFYIRTIRESLDRLQRLDFDRQNTVSRTMATLEYYLTKSYMRYSSGQRFGYVSPDKYYNHLFKDKQDSTGRRYMTLFSSGVDEFGPAFFQTALRCAREYMLDRFLTEVQPRSPLYYRLKAQYNKPGTPASERRCLAVNMERSRWRLHQNSEGKYVEVNLPAQQLTACDDNGNQLTMKICYGSAEHKTPLVSSKITRLELNPFWIIPKSIIRKDIVHHIGDTAYFSNKRFKIVDLNTGEYVSPLVASREMLESRRYIVRQDKGEDNSLGRMIFRFPNHFSIYLHDTNNKEAFNQEWRAVSHGCIRLEKPFDLAVFLLNKPDEDYIDLMRLSLDMEPLTDHGRKLKEEKSFKPLKYCDYKPAIPLNIVYYTCYPSADNGAFIYYPDVYHYDTGLYELLSAS
jgi:murein L,D-transpeptidase YcbB/YkuD